MTTYDRLIALDGAHNVRDLGGYRTQDGGSTRWRSLLRGDALHALSDADMENLRSQGLSTVIDLRNPAEIAREANPFDGALAMRYVNIPIFSALAPVEMMAAERAGFDMGERYCAGFDACQDAIAAVLTAIADVRTGAVLFHCSAGKDRTGIVAALLLANAGVEDATIVEDYALTATIAEPLLAKLRERAVAGGTSAEVIDIVLAAEPGSMSRALRHLQTRYGGVRPYLTRIGLTDAVVSALKSRLMSA